MAPDTNSDGVLQPTEINPAQTQYVCDGGSTVNTLLTSMTVPSMTLCDAGGRIVSHGLDNGDNGGAAANGLLESGEIDFSTTYCTTYEIELMIDINTYTHSNGDGYGSHPRQMMTHMIVSYTLVHAHLQVHGPWPSTVVLDWQCKIFPMTS